MVSQRTGREKFRDFNLARYAKMSFGMFGGDPVNVRIAFANDIAGIFIDRFGRNIVIYPSEQDGWSEINVDVAMSDQFLGWIFAIGPKARILGPEEVAMRFREKLGK